MPLLPCVEIEPKGTANAAVILLHGLGANGHDFEPMVPELQLPKDAAVRFVFPHAPAIPVTINGGMVMPAWYDILEMSIERKIDTAQILASADAVHRLTERERERGIASERIIVAGFSQGGAVAIQAALTFPERLAGLLVMSSYFATADSIQPNAANEDLPVLVCHGSYDPVVPESLGQRATEQLSARGYPTSYKRYPMEHTLCLPQIQDVSRWLRERLELG